MKLYIFFILFAIIFVASAAPSIYDWQERNQDPISIRGGVGDNNGKDVHIDAQARLWQSENKRHEIHGFGHYGQHLGGPWGNSRPSYGIGGGYVYRF